MAQGIQTSYVGTIPQKRTVSDKIFMITPERIPLITALGTNADSKFRFVNTPGTMYEWLMDDFSPVYATMADAEWDDNATEVNMTVDDATVFQVGDVLQIDDEFVHVTSITSTTVIVVTRSHGTPAAASHATTSTVYLRSRARLEGADAGDSHYTQPTSGYNYSHIMQKTIKIARSDARLNRYGISNLEDYEIQKKTQELMFDLNRKAYYGQREAGSATTPRDTGGLDVFITTNVTAASSAALTLKHIEDNVQLILAAGGNPSLLVCNGWAKRKITGFFSGGVVQERTDKYGGIETQRIQSALGPVLDVLVDWTCPTDHIYILSPESISFVTLDELFYEDLGKHGDTAAYGELVGEYGLAVACQTHHGIVSGFSTTA
jgi:hypothetical protein